MASHRNQSICKGDRNGNQSGTLTENAHLGSVCFYEQAHVNTLNYLFLAALTRTWAVNNERQWPLVCQHSCHSVLCWQGVSLTLGKLLCLHDVGWEQTPHRGEAILLHCMCFSSDSTSTYETLSANCRSQKNTSHPSGIFMSLEPLSLQLPTPCTQKTFLQFYFLHALELVFLPHATGSPVKVVGSRWGRLKTSYLPGYCINQKDS